VIDEPLTAALSGSRVSRILNTSLRKGSLEIK